MSSITSSAVRIQTSPQAVPSTPSWLGEVAVVAHYLQRLGLLKAIEERVRFARRRFGHYEVLDFVAVLIGYALSGEATLQAFYERLQPFALPFMALFGRRQLPHRSTLSRFLCALDQPTVEALRSLFQQDLERQPLGQDRCLHGGLWDRQGTQWMVFDVDGTRQAARQRALPHTSDLPAAQRRFQQVCAPGYLGRQRGEVVRTRTTIGQAHTHHWLGTFSGAGNGDYRGELLRASQVIVSYLRGQHLPVERAILRLDGQYGNGAPLADVARSGVAWVTRGRDYALLDLPQMLQRLALPPDQETTHPETGTRRALFECPQVCLTLTGPLTRLIVATHPASSSPASIGSTRDGVVYELFFTALPAGAFSPADIVALYQQRGAFEAILSDEDHEQDPDRWCSHTPWGQECWQVVSQWMWNLRLELGHGLHPSAMRTTELAAAHAPSAPPPPALVPPPPPPPPLPQAPLPLLGGFAADAFLLQPDGTLRCPEGKPLYARGEQRPEREGRVRVFYAARIADCRACPKREPCQGNTAARTPRQVSLVMRPNPDSVLFPAVPLSLAPPSLAILWGDWSRCHTRRQWMALLRTQTLTLSVEQGTALAASAPVVTRRQRAHWRLSWAERMSRNACSLPASSIHLHLFGLPTAFATSLGLI
jgi:hypothetical protein